MTKSEVLLTFILILIVMVATIHMVNRAISIDNSKQAEETNLK